MALVVQKGSIGKLVWALSVVLVVGNFSCLTLYFLNGFGVTDLSDAALGYLGIATVGQVGGLLALLFKAVTPH